jgi:hypothetical protein
MTSLTDATAGIGLPEHKVAKVRKLKETTNAASRAFSDGGELLNKAKDAVTQLGKRVLEVPLGQRLNRSPEQALQKARFKLLHKKAHTIATASAAGGAPAWTADTPVDRELFVQQCKKDLNEQLERYREKVSNEGKGLGLGSMLSSLLTKDAGLVFLRPADGKKLHFFSVAFFNAAQSADDDASTSTAPAATISWNAFKTTVFDAYIKTRAAKIKTVEDELTLLKKLDRSFTQLVSETSTSSSSTTASDDAPPKVALVLLRNRLKKERMFDVADSFWANSIWNAEHEQDLVTRADFLKTAGGHESIEELELVLLELKEDCRSEVSSKDLVLVAPAPATAAPAPAVPAVPAAAATSTADASSKPEIKKEVKRQSKKGAASAAAVDLSGAKDMDAGINELSRRDILSGLLQAGIAPELARDFDRYSPPVRESLVVLGQQVSAKLKGKEESTAKYAFLNLGTMISNKIDGLKDDLKHLKAVLSSHGSKMKQVTAEERQALQDEVEALTLNIDRSEKEKEHIEKIVRNKYRSVSLAKQSAAAAASSKAGAAASSQVHKLDQTPSLLPLAITQQAFEIEQQSVPFALQSSSTSAGSAASDLVVDFASTLHEVFDVPAAAVASGTAFAGFVYAIITIKEWQTYLGNRSMERLSLEFLARLVGDFQPDKSLQSAADALLKVQTFGLLSDAEFRDFSQDPKGVSSKTLAAIKVKAIQRTIDSWASVTSLSALRDALTRYGPLLITLPNMARDKRADGFWRESKRSSDSGDVQEWEHLVITGISDRTKSISVRFCMGKQWGCFGQAQIGYDELFNAKSGLVTRNMALITALLDKSLLA